MIKVDTRIKQETLDRVKKEAVKQKRSFCGMLRVIVESYFEKNVK